MVLHHIGIVVDSLAEATPLFELWIGARRVGGVVEDEVQGARVQLFTMRDDTTLEVLEPMRGRRFHQAGDYHLCFTVPDLDVEMKRLHALGTIVTRPAVRISLFNNRRLAFLATSSGQLLELLEEERVPV
jgi:catechol 2,3-dioxygenase-like lactoylglutathione lyase family enzyme